MNWRIDLQYDQCVYLCENNRIEALRERDQLTQHRKSRPLTSRMNEGILDFKPTFKYDPDCDVYDTSKKMRVPSWTDRILYKPQSCTILYYNRREHRFSDHRPVLGIFECVVT